MPHVTFMCLQHCKHDQLKVFCPPAAGHANVRLCQLIAMSVTKSSLSAKAAFFASATASIMFDKAPPGPHADHLLGT